MAENDTSKPKPFLRWAGGKRRSIPFLEKHLPRNFKRYFEPFLGAGSLFFHINPSNAFLSDKNRCLIECYNAVKEDPELVSRYLQEHLQKSSKDYYLYMRKKYNESEYSISKAAIFIYLNKTCFNGIWRVNGKGEFNVPYGEKEPPNLPSKDDLVSVSKALSKVAISQKDYKDVVDDIDKGDFVYFDPPYPPLNGTSNFTHYTKERFAKEDHYELAQVAKKLNNKGCYVLISNSSTEHIHSLYKDEFNIFELEVMRCIRADGKRYKIREIAITNYDQCLSSDKEINNLDG